MKKQNTRMAPVSTYNRCLNKVMQYATKKGITVNPNSRTFLYLEEDNLINLSNKCKGQYKYICFFLHELGHAIQPDSIFHKLKYQTHNINKLIIFEQEYTAWVLGYQIAKRLHIDNTIRDTYFKEASLALGSYMTYLHKGKKEVIAHIAKNGYPAVGIDPI
jgi:hypothetical protein